MGYVEQILKEKDLELGEMKKMNEKLISIITDKLIDGKTDKT